MLKKLSNIINKRIDEATFSSANLEKVAKLYASLLGKTFGGKWYVFNEENFKSKGREGRGIRLLSDEAKQVRFNFDQRTGGLSKGNFYISSIDYWDGKELQFNKPTLTVEFQVDINVVKIWNKIFNALKNNEIGKIGLNESTAKIITNGDNLFEAKISIYDVPEDKFYRGTKEDRIAFAKKYKWRDDNYANTQYDTEGTERYDRWKDIINDKYKKEKWKAEWQDFIAEVYPGGVEENDLENLFDEYERMFEETKYVDAEYVFDDIETMTELVNDAVNNTTEEVRSFILCGLGGLGKTFHVQKALNRLYDGVVGGYVFEKAPKWSLIKFYQMLSRNRDKLFFLDEADMLLDNPEVKLLLKGALDTTSSKYGLLISYGTDTLPIGDDPRYIEKYSQWVYDMWKYDKVPAVQVQPKDILEFQMENIIKKMDDGEQIEKIALPNHFYFKGAMIFISNMKMQNLDQAVISRSYCVDLNLSASDVFRRMQFIDTHNSGRTKLESAKRLAGLAKIYGLKLNFDDEGNIEVNKKFNELYEKRQLTLNMRTLIQYNKFYDKCGGDAALRLASYGIARR